jgi:hypothetical protein
MKNIEKPKLIEALKKGTVTVTFFKKNGEVRVMPCTLNAKFINANNGIKDYSINQHFEEKTTKETEQIPVWDTENNGWRSFNESSLISWEIYGE